MAVHVSGWVTAQPEFPASQGTSAVEEHGLGGDSRNGDIQADPDEAGDTEPKFRESSLPGEVALPLPSEDTNPALPEQPGMTLRR